MKHLRLMVGEQGKRLYRCRDCGAVDHWKEGWRWFGSIKDLDDGVDVPCFCPKCAKNKGKV